ncbi:MAG TPA: pyridoxal-phosphate dependent enzyme, partial [Ktedonobacterales bacterium]|nr:pyridoxal-phosphate dependent enzyme [Ktedonobacterales bacterium]
MTTADSASATTTEPSGTPDTSDTPNGHAPKSAAKKAVRPESSATPEGAPRADVPASAGMEELRLPSVTDVWRAQEVIRPHVYHTPLLPSRTLGGMSGAKVYLKAENLQRSGAYKLRGATYKLSRLTSEERERGVIAASAGNHAQGVAIAASALGVPCTIAMPTAAPLAKIT